MKNLNFPYKLLKVYQVNPEELDRLKFDKESLNPMLTPNFKDFNDVFNRASVGLSETKKRQGGLICYKRIGVKHGYSNVYSNQSNSFDILHEDHLKLVDEVNADGLELVKDFLNLKK